MSRSESILLKQHDSHQFPFAADVRGFNKRRFVGLAGRARVHFNTLHDQRDSWHVGVDGWQYRGNIHDWWRAGVLFHVHKRGGWHQNIDGGQGGGDHSVGRLNGFSNGASGNNSEGVTEFADQNPVICVLAGVSVDVESRMFLPIERKRWKGCLCVVVRVAITHMVDGA